MRNLLLVLVTILSLGLVIASFGEELVFNKQTKVEVIMCEDGYAFTSIKGIHMCKATFALPQSQWNLILYHELGHVALKHTGMYRILAEWYDDRGTSPLVQAKIQEMLRQMERDADNYAFEILLQEGGTAQSCDLFLVFKGWEKDMIFHPSNKSRYTACINKMNRIALPYEELVKQGYAKDKK